MPADQTPTKGTTMTVATTLTTLGWRVDSTDRLTQAVRDFQRIWNLGPQLAADGDPGPKTLDALAVSLARHHAGQPDISAHFSAVEFRCECSGYDDCDRIWTPRAVVQGAEALRALFGSYSPDRAGRCPTQNRNVGGVSDSSHLTGYALDIPVFKVDIAKIRALRLFSGLGHYTYGKRTYVRHVDMRHLAGSVSKPGSPATWPYPHPEKHTPREPNPNTQEDDDMSAEDSARLKTIEATLDAFVKTEAARYGVDTNRYKHLAGKVGAPIDVDEAALAASLAPALTAAVTEAAAAAGIPDVDALAGAVVARFGAALTTAKESR